MSILTSLYSGATGLTAQGLGIAVIGDNVANVNTIGYKASRPTFQDVLGMTVQAGGQNPGQVGLGVRFAGSDSLFIQGPLTTTGRTTDLAIDGGGFFVVAGNVRGSNSNFYSRSGQVRVDSEGFLVNFQGLRVQGYSPDATGKMSSTLGPLQIGAGSLAPRRSSEITLHAALDVASPPPPAWDPAQADATSNFSTSVPVYDSLGRAHNVQVYFRNTGAGGTWEWHAVVDGGLLAGGVPGIPVDVANGTLVFTNTGALAQVNTNANTFNFNGAAPGQVVTFNFGDPIAAGGTGLRGTTAMSQPFSVGRLEQDGYGPGSFSQMSIGPDGTITGVFTNGQRRPIGQIAVASFLSEAGLRREGSSLYSATVQSGEPMVGSPGTGARGSILSGTLEQSNVDLADQFVQLIALQRGFQSNSKTIQTSDENYVTLVQLKR